MTVNGGHFHVGGGIDLTDPSDPSDEANDGTLIIHDHNTRNEEAQNGLTVGGDVTAGGLQMTGGDTMLHVGGEVNLSGGADLKGNADVQTGGTFTTEKDLVLEGNATLTSDADATADKKKVAVGGNLDVKDNASIDRGEITVALNAHVNGTGGVKAEGGMTVGGAMAVGTGKDIHDADTEAGHPTVSITEGALQTGGGLTVEGGSVGLMGEASEANPDAGGIKVGFKSDGNPSDTQADLVIGKEGVTTPIVSVEAEGDVKVGNGNAVIHGNGSLTAGGDFVVKGTDPANGDASFAGKAEIAGSTSTSGDLTIGKNYGTEEAPSPNGSFTTGGKADVAGNLTLHENAELSVGQNPKTAGEDGLTVGGNASIGKNASVEVGGDITLTGSAESGAPTFSMGEGSTITAGGKFAAGSSQIVSATDDDADKTLQGFITAPEGIDFSAASGSDGGTGDPSDIIFSGASAGTSTSHFKGDVTYTNGARFELTEGTGAEGAPEPGKVEGMITIAAGVDADDPAHDQPGAVFTTNASYRPAAGTETNAHLYVDRKLTFPGGSDANPVGIKQGTLDETALGSARTDHPAGGIFAGDGSSIFIELSGFASGDVVFGDGTDEGFLPLVNVAARDEGEMVPIEIGLSGWTLGKGGTINIGLQVDKSVEGEEFTDQQRLEKSGFTVEGFNGLLDFGLTTEGFLAMSGATAHEYSGLDGQYGRAVNAVFDENGHPVVQGALGAAFMKYAEVDGDAKSISKAGAQAVQDILTVPMAAGVFNAAYDYLTEVNAATDSRLSVLSEQTPLGTTVWAHVIGAKTKSDKLFGESGYEADLRGGVLGMDVGLTDATAVGAAITVGTGDVDAVGSTLSMTNDATFWGVTAYATTKLGVLTMKGDVGYLRAENDIKARFEGWDLGGTVDTDAVTAGVRVEFAAYETSRFTVTPHVGARFTQYSFETIHGTEMRDVNVFETPIGVAVTGSFEANGWKLAPTADVTVVPQLADRKAEIVNSGATVEEHVLNGALFNAALGFLAEKDAFALGVGYKFGIGNMDRENHTFMIRGSYRW